MRSDHLSGTTPAQKKSWQANPDGIMLSNGPGDPKECTEIIEEIKKLYDSRCTDLCNLSGTSAHGTCDRRGYPQDEIRTPWRQPSGQGSCRPDVSTSPPRTMAMWLMSDKLGSVPLRQPAFVNVNDGTNEGIEIYQERISLRCSSIRKPALDHRIVDICLTVLLK